jgi:hypothetical protein
LKNLRESGAIEQDADVVLFTWKPEEDANGTVQGKGRQSYAHKITQAKKRNGRTGESWVTFHTTTTTFRGLPKAGQRGRTLGVKGGQGKDHAQPELSSGHGPGMYSTNT